MTARNVVVNGEVFSLVPAEHAAKVARIVERAFDDGAPEWQYDDGLLFAVSVLRCAPMVDPDDADPLTVSSWGKSGEGRLAGWLSTAEAAALVGVEPRSMRYRVDRGSVRSEWRDGRLYIDPASIEELAA